MSLRDTRAAEVVSVRIWVGFAAMCVGMFMAILDVQVVATSLPTIQRALSIPQSQMSWIQTAYLIAEIISIPLTGILTRTLTMRRLFVGAVCMFTVASVGCSMSGSFLALIAWRIVQGFSGGTLIPAVFSAVFLLFPISLQPIATVIAGVLAVLAPTLGPVVGGWITATYSWPWLFLINVLPGLLSAMIAYGSLTRGPADLPQLRQLGVGTLVLGGFALAALEIAIKEGPTAGWRAPLPIALLASCLITALGFVWRTLNSLRPVVDLRLFQDINFTIGCVLSFILGMGLFGSVYLMPVFLAYVRGHNALDIGKIMIVTGTAQLVAAPIAVALVRRWDDRLLSALGFLAFAIGLAMSYSETRATDFAGMFWPQFIRGWAIMFCILPPTQLALGQLAKDKVADASGLFNMMRNLGGAIGIALIDTIIYTRAPEYGRRIADRLIGGDVSFARSIGISLDTLQAALVDSRQQAALVKMVHKIAFVDAINDAWALIAIVTLVALLAIPWASRTPESARRGFYE